MTEARRDALGVELHGLWSEYFHGQDCAAFVRSHLFDDTTLILGRGAAGELAGFGYINPRVLTVEGRAVLVLGGGVFNRVRYAGSAAVALGCLAAGAKLRFRHRDKDCVAVSVATHPLIYDLTARVLPTIAPRPGPPPPPSALEIVHQVARARGLPVDPGDPWLVQFYGRAAQADQLKASRAYAKRSPAMAWFEARAPRWAEGQALLVWAPVDAANLLGAAARLARHLLAHG